MRGSWDGRVARAAARFLDEVAGRPDVLGRDLPRHRAALGRDAPGCPTAQSAQRVPELS
jgi:hypothetical protein